MANALTKARLIQRPEIVLLLQPWSTATTQTTNRIIAPTARIFMSIIETSRPKTALREVRFDIDSANPGDAVSLLTLRGEIEDLKCGHSSNGRSASGS